MVVAPIEKGREGDLRQLLSSMNHRPGVVNPHNAIVPFGQFDRLHFARIVILNDQTLNDISAHGVDPLDLPPSLAFLGDCDGPSRDLLTELVVRAGSGLRQMFSHCQGFTPDEDLLTWMNRHEQRPAIMYVNWVGRTVRQVREENDLWNVLQAHLQRNAATYAERHPRQIRDSLREFVTVERRAGRLTLTAPESTPLSWRLRNLLHGMGVPFVFLFLMLLLVPYFPFFAYQLRRRERQDPEIAPRIDSNHAKKLAGLEDHDVTNQFSALGSLKPGLFRRWTLIVLLWVLNYTTRHIFNRGRLARVATIHFARWVFLDQKKRLFFASNYDGSLESYMDDFINKVAWGLNLVFSNGVGYPRTRWLVLDGAKDEQRFKYYIRRHELPTEVWYNAHPGLTAFDMERNTRIRQGLKKSTMTDAEIREWLSLL
jgi:hypothetical protein